MDADSFWRSFVESHEETEPRAYGESERASQRGSTGRLLDAAIVVVRAARDLTTIAEEVLIEQRDRMDRPRDKPRGRDDGVGREGQPIDLTY